MAEPIDIMKDAWANNYMGSITDLIDQSIATPETQEGKEIGMTGGPETTRINDAQSITTENMTHPIDMQVIDQQTGLVDSSMTNVQPGELVETGAGKDVIETPSMRDGGTLRDKANRYLKNR